MLIYPTRRLLCQLYVTSKSVRKKFSRGQYKYFERMVRQTHEESPAKSAIFTDKGNQKYLNYQEAICTLNKLQGNVDVLERAKRFPEESALRNVPDTIKYLARLGIMVSDLDKLKAIHVSGTKGKGSTCAFCESILRHHGLKTGFFSSPHMIAVRERIRINGQPLSEDAFAYYFWEVYDALIQRREKVDDMPPYFKFLTVMAYYTFLKEKVDVAIVEVGIGGQYDCTNAIRNPAVCGISSLGLDHTLILGSTLKKIAWQKAGIMKAGVCAFTSPQNEEAMTVLTERATNIGAKLHVSLTLQNHIWNGEKITLGLSGETQETNAALAVHLTNYWLQKYKMLPNLISNEISTKEGPVIEISKMMANGLRNCQWAGRYQVLRQDNLFYYLDGAHTHESIQTCIKWFNDSINNERRCKRIIKGLLFSITGDRAPESLLSPLLEGQFNFVCFSPTILYDSNHAPAPADLLSTSVSKEYLRMRSNTAETVWIKLREKKRLIENESGVNADYLRQWTKTFTNISKALTYLQTKQFIDEVRANVDSSINLFENDVEVHLLVTGSLHLVGGVLGILNPNLNGGGS